MEKINQYKNQFTKFNEEDNLHFPDNDINLFVGSSTIRHWYTLTEDMHPKKVLNRGFGGSTMRQLLEFSNQLILKYKFKKIFIYEGDNDIGRKRNKVNIVVEQFQELVKIIHTHQPEAEIIFLSIKCSPYRRKNCKNYQLANKIIEDYCKTEQFLKYIDIASGFFDENNNIKTDFFNENDGIHPSEKGYKHLTNILKKHLY